MVLNIAKNHENRHFHVSDFKYRCCGQKISSFPVKIHLSSKFQPLKSSEQETPAVHKQTDRQTNRRNFLRHQEKFAPITWNCHRGKPAGGSSKREETSELKRSAAVALTEGILLLVDAELIGLSQFTSQFRVALRSA